MVAKEVPAAGVVTGVVTVVAMAEAMGAVTVEAVGGADNP